MANWSEDVPGLADRANMVSAERRRNEWVLTGLGISGPDNYFGQGDIWGTRILNKMKHNATTSCHIRKIYRLILTDCFFFQLRLRWLAMCAKTPPYTYSF